MNEQSLPGGLPGRSLEPQETIIKPQPMQDGVAKRPAYAEGMDQIDWQAADSAALLSGCAGRQLLAQPVRGLQYMLRRLAEYNHILPRLEIDGVLGEETMEAVMLFQREYFPPVTGAIDWKTWSAIRESWMALEQQLSRIKPLRVFPGEGCWVEPWGDREYMILPQAMFQVLSRYFDGISPDVTDGIHGNASVENVCWLQRAAGLRESGIMDSLCWRLLSSLYEIFVVKEQYGSVKRRMADGWG